MDLSTVIVNWNSGPRLSVLIASLEGLRDELNEILVVDNASKDGSAEVAGNLDWVSLTRFPENRGFAGAANFGISESVGSWVLLLNPDIRIEPESVRGLYQAAHQLPKSAVVCGQLISTSGESQQTFQIRDLPTLRSVLADAFFIEEWAGNAGAGATLKRFDSQGAYEVEQPAAACWLLRKEAWIAVDGFDESFHPAWFEDVDFCRRILEKGNWKVYYLPHFTIAHEGGASVSELGYSSFLKLYYGNLLRYWKKHHYSSYLPVWIVVKLSLAVRLIHTRFCR